MYPVSSPLPGQEAGPTKHFSGRKKAAPLSFSFPPPLRSCVMKKGESLSCCIKDESRPLGFGGQKLEPNHPMRLLKRAVVVSDPGKGHQEWSGTYYGDERK